MSWWHLVPWWLIVAAVLLLVLFVQGVLTSRTAGVLALMVALLFIGFRWGSTEVDHAWQAKEEKRLQAEASAREAEQRRGEKAGGELGVQLRQLAIDNDELTGAFNAYKRQHPLVVIHKQPRVAGALVAPAPSGTGAAVPADPAPSDTELAEVGLGIRVTRGAVWMWNSALFQHDTPSGACGLANQTDAACAPETSLSLQDAWDNQSINARICAVNSVMHNKLIDFIEGKKK